MEGLNQCSFDSSAKGIYSEWYKYKDGSGCPPGGCNRNSPERHLDDPFVVSTCCGKPKDIPTTCLYKGTLDQSTKVGYTAFYTDQPTCPKYLGCIQYNDAPFNKLNNCTNPKEPDLQKALSDHSNNLKVVSSPKDAEWWQWTLVTENTDGLGFCPIGYCPESKDCLAPMEKACTSNWDSVCETYVSGLSEAVKREFIGYVVPRNLSSGKMSEAKAAELCGQVPGVCDSFLQATSPTPSSSGGYCSRYDRKDMEDVNHRSLCGCYLYPSTGNYPYLGKSIGVTCDYICTSAEVPRSKNNQAEYCTDSICIMDDITVNIINSKVSGDIKFSELCGNCKGKDSGCQCYFTDLQINDIDSLVSGGIDFEADCGGGCFTSDQQHPFPGGCPGSAKKCTSNKECPIVGTECVNGKCVPVGGKCSSNKECNSGAGEKCVDGRCVADGGGENLWERFLKWWDASNIHKAIVIVGVLFVIFALVILGVFVFEGSKSKSSSTTPSFNPYLYTS